MNKRERHNIIKAMIQEEKIKRQMDIQERLQRMGVSVTQTTLSRDLRELGLVKVHEDNQTFYVLPDEESQATLGQILASSVRKVERAQFMLVFHTELGEAALMANAIDAEKPDEVLGTVAGADTLFVVCRDDVAAQKLQAEVEENLG